MAEAPQTLVGRVRRSSRVKGAMSIGPSGAACGDLSVTLRTMAFRPSASPNSLRAAALWKRPSRKMAESGTVAVRRWRTLKNR